MAEAKDEQSKLETPAGSEIASVNGMFVTMPNEYRHGASGKLMAEPQKTEKKLVQAPAPAPAQRPVPKPLPGPAPAVVRPGMATSTKVIITVGIILLTGLSVAAYIVISGLRPVEIAQPTPITTEPTTPEPTTPEPTTPEPTTPEPTTPEPTTPEPTSPFPNGVTPGADTDSDGLTDVEERIVYGTDPFLPDTDSDGFLDGNEVFHRYNPVALAPGTLVESGLALTYDDEDAPEGVSLPYAILYPSIWQTEVQEANPLNVVFVATTGETIVLTVTTKSVDQDLQTWIRQQSPGANVVSTTTKNGYDALITQDQMTAYVDGGQYVLIFSYNTGIKGTVDYLQTFQMMLNSIELNDL